MIEKAKKMTVANFMRFCVASMIALDILGVAASISRAQDAVTKPSPKLGFDQDEKFVPIGAGEPWRGGGSPPSAAAGGRLPAATDTCFFGIF
jgi:hypothetical protein